MTKQQTQEPNRNQRELSHLSSEELTAILYEVPVPDQDAVRHVDVCAQCQGRLRAMQGLGRGQTGLSAAQQTRLADRALASQRASIYSRMDASRPSLGSRWLWTAAPLAAAAALLVTVNLGSLNQAPAKPVQSASNAPSAAVELADDTLYADIYQSLSQVGPTGVHTVAGMFDVEAKN